MEEKEIGVQIDTWHILLWLLKDTLWVMSFKYLAIAMIIPTVLYTLYILKLNYQQKFYFFNYLAILFWLLGNSFWILNDFLFNQKYVWVCYILFSIGIVILLLQLLTKLIRYVRK